MIRPIILKEAIQIEVTNACTGRCSNCTRLVGHHKEPYFMDLDYFKEVVDSLESTTKMVGMIGGEPLLCPEFEEMCLYLQKKFHRAQLGLWSSLPENKKHYARVISGTFGALLPNDHSEGGIYHSPILVRSKELINNELEFITAVKNCWLQKAWSASINPKGAYFCEVAAAIDLLLDTGTAFDIHTKWWLKKPVEYLDQINALCANCGVCLALTPRLDTEGIDDVDPWWQKKLFEAKSPKMKKGKYRVYQGQAYDPNNYNINSFRKDLGYLQAIGTRFGLDLKLKYNGYLRPYLKEEKQSA